MEPSPLDRKLRRLQDDSPHVVIIARAGTGKTTTLVDGLQQYYGNSPSITPSEQQGDIWQQLSATPDGAKVCFVAFNKMIAAELQERVPPECDAMTMHSMGFKAVRQAFGNVQFSQYRVRDLISELTNMNSKELRLKKWNVLVATEKLVALCKQNLIGIDPVNNRSDRFDSEEFYAALDDLSQYYQVNVNNIKVEVFDLVGRVLTACKEVEYDECLDFDDMTWLPVVLNLAMQQYDMLLVDEAQDLNRCQQELALKAGRRLILCGDPKQAIYGFAGADAESMDRMSKLLGETDRGCVTLPLNITYRCGKAIVTEAQTIVPDYTAYEENPEGFVSHTTFYKYQKTVEVGDMLLCRCNAPLVIQCFRFLQEGKKAHIQGRDIGRGLISTIKRLHCKTVDQLSQRLDEWYTKESAKELKKLHPRGSHLIALQDRMNCITTFAEKCNTIEMVISSIENVFADDSQESILLSSIHKAKGLEARNVFLLEPPEAPVPHPMASTDWQQEQELNLRYVAITRAIENLVFVS